jgi:DNA-binding XRE family transcriptional regulator
MADEDIRSFVNMRLEKNLTQRDIAVALGVTEDTVANWERGRSTPKLTIPQVKKLCEILEKPIEALPDDFRTA